MKDCIPLYALLILSSAPALASMQKSGAEMQFPLYTASGTKETAEAEGLECLLPWAGAFEKNTKENVELDTPRRGTNSKEDLKQAYIQLKRIVYKENPNIDEVRSRKNYIEGLKMQPNGATALSLLYGEPRTKRMIQDVDRKIKKLIPNDAAQKTAAE
jgi:hypothetical protein